jgi:hypothetical protein
MLERWNRMEPTEDKHYLVYGIRSSEICIPLSARNKRDAHNKTTSKTFTITRIEEIVYPDEE